MQKYATEMDQLKSQEQSLHIALSHALMEADHPKIVDVCRNLILVTTLQQEYYQLNKGASPHLHHEKSNKMRHYEALLSSFSKTDFAASAAS